MRYKKLYPAVICFCVFLAAIGLVLGVPLDLCCQDCGRSSLRRTR